MCASWLAGALVGGTRCLHTALRWTEGGREEGRKGGNFLCTFEESHPPLSSSLSSSPPSCCLFCLRVCSSCKEQGGRIVRASLFSSFLKKSSPRSTSVVRQMRETLPLGRSTGRRKREGKKAERVGSWQSIDASAREVQTVSSLSLFVSLVSLCPLLYLCRSVGRFTENAATLHPS